MENLEVGVCRKECGEAVETLSRAPEVVEGKRCETFPASTQVEVVRDRAGETGATGASVRYVKILQQGQTAKPSFSHICSYLQVGEACEQSSDAKELWVLCSAIGTLDRFDRNGGHPHELESLGESEKRSLGKYKRTTGVFFVRLLPLSSSESWSSEGKNIVLSLRSTRLSWGHLSRVGHRLAIEMSE